MVCLLLLSACASGGFRVDKFAGEPVALFTAARRELTLRHWENAIAGFEKLTTDLPARDTLLPLAQFYLGQARSGNVEHLLAAQAFNKVAEGYPEDTIADDALFESAREYQRLWRSPELDSQYGATAQASFRTLLAVYPDSPRRKDAEQALLALDEMFARKEYLAGYYYYRRKAYDPAILYFKGVVAQYAETATARDAYVKMIESYRAIRYTEEATEACAAAQRRFAADVAIKALCPPSAAKTDSTTAPAAPAPAKP